MRSLALFAGVLIAAAPLAAHAADYIPVDATDFSKCPKDSPNMADPGLGSSATWNTNSSPFQPHTWSGTNHHWVFVSTSSGVQVFDLHSGSAVASGTIGSGSGYTGIELVDAGVSGHRLLVALRSDERVQVWDVGFSNPATASFVGDVNLQVSKSGYWPCAVGGANDSSVSAGAIAVLGSSVTPGVVFVANECTGGDQGSIDVLTVTGSANPVLSQRVRADKNPTGLALGSSDTLLYLINEKAGLATQALMSPASIGASVGSLMTFSLDTTPALGQDYVVLETSVNAGCTPVRLVAGGGRVWVTARGSHDIQVFDATNLLNDPVDSRLAVFQVGPAPVGLKLVDSGSSIAVVNSNRFDDLTLPKPSFMVFKISTLTGLTGWGDHGQTRLAASPCLTRGVPNGYGDFPRNLAADNERVYMTLAGAAKVKWVNLSSIQSSCP